ncbi:MAG TPA: acyl carrier protein [Devosia sp.]|nr:acyl carrier protein [Devosia sp.]
MNFLREACPEEARPSLTEQTRLMEDGILDSFGVVRLIGFLEEQFGIVVPDGDIGPDLLASGAELALYVESRRRSGDRRPVATVAQLAAE